MTSSLKLFLILNYIKQIDSKLPCVSDTHGYASCATFLFLPHFDVLCDLLLNRRTATWNLFVLYNKELKKSFNDDVIDASVLQ